MPAYTEDTLVQKTTAEYLEQALGWESVYAYNQETFGPEGLLGRGSDREVVLVRYLRRALEGLNPGLPAAAYDDAVRQLATPTAMQSLMATNREKYDMIRDGVMVTFRNDKGERVRERLRVIDFVDSTNNHFLCVRELWVKGDLYRRRADIVGFVNGLPLLFVEVKNVHRNLLTAYEKNLRDYKVTIPHLFHHNAFVVLGNGEDAKIGSISSQYKHFRQWKRLAENDPGAVDMETLLKGVCDKANFIDLLENFILFDESAGEPRKIVAQNQQFLGVNRAVAQVEKRKELDGRLGVYWHTQGAGKSYSIVFFARKVHRKLGGNYTFLVLTDRDDLDTQIYKTAAGCGLITNDAEDCRASSGEHLKRALTQQKSYIFSLIQKFNQRVEPGQPYTMRDDIIVITDEAHRTQYGTLALNLRNALPNASYIGFTGTPLMKGDEITRRVFGNYISTYDFQRAVEDGSTVPLYYDARGEKLKVAVGDLNERIAAKLEEIEIDDIDVSQRLEQELKRDYHIITATKRLERVARDFVWHYSTSWQSGKAMMVCIDKVTCVRMYDLISRFWDERIAELEKELKTVVAEDERQIREQQLAWMRETRMAVVVSEEQGEVEKFRNWDVDIIPHRRLLKDGIDLPEELRRRPEYANIARMALDDAFKVKEHPFRIAIVCAMWLTGFDVPSLANMYLDKPLKAHTLMQAIARANRVDEGKNNGLIVDYIGVLKALRQALATFAGVNDEGRVDGTEGGSKPGPEPAKPNEELLEELEEALALVKGFLSEGNFSLKSIINQTGFARIQAICGAKEVANRNDETRKRFEVLCRAVFTKYKACLTIQPEINNYRDYHDAISIVYKKLNEDKERADISAQIKSLHDIVDEAIIVESFHIAEGSGVYDISKIDFDKLRKEFERSQYKNTSVQNLKAVLDKRLQRLLEQNPLRTDFQKHYEEIISEYNSEKDAAMIQKTFEALLTLVSELDAEEARSVKEGLDPEQLALFDLLMRPDISGPETKRIKKVASDLLATLKAEKLRVDRWREKEAARDSVKQAIIDYLWNEQTGLPASFGDEEVHARAENVYRHILRVYSEVPSPVYYNSRCIGR